MSHPFSNLAHVHQTNALPEASGLPAPQERPVPEAAEADLPELLVRPPWSGKRPAQAGAADAPPARIRKPGKWFDPARLPQVLLNVSGVDKSRADEDAVLAAAVAEEEAVLGERGRILLRPSGTEPIVRVMVEAPTEDEAEGVASRLADVVRTQLALQ